LKKKAKTWVSELQEKSSPNQVTAFVGNKKDLPNRLVDLSEVEKYANETNLIFIETSALDGENVIQLFQLLAKKSQKI